MTIAFVLFQSGQDIQLELSAHSLPNEKEVDRITVLHSVEGFSLVMLCRYIYWPVLFIVTAIRKNNRNKQNHTPISRRITEMA